MMRRTECKIIKKADKIEMRNFLKKSYYNNLLQFNNSSIPILFDEYMIRISFSEHFRKLQVRGKSIPRSVTKVSINFFQYGFI